MLFKKNNKISNQQSTDSNKPLSKVKKNLSYETRLMKCTNNFRFGNKNA